MKPLKMLGLAALAALMAMAFVGASSATAATHLCSADESPCAEANIITHVHETSVGKAILLASPKVECNVLFLGEVEEGEAGQAEIKGNFTYTSCTSGCSVTEQSASSVIGAEKMGHEFAGVISESEIHVKCIGINCYYHWVLLGTANGPLLSFPANGEVSIQEEEVEIKEGTLCPNDPPKLDITTTPLSATHITE